MSFSQTETYQIGGAGVNITRSKTYTGEGYTSLDVSAPIASDTEYVFALDISQIISLFFVSDQNVTLEFNDNVGAGGTIALVANVPYIENSDFYFAASLITANTTLVFITNASGAVASVQLSVLHDPTP